MAYGRGTARLTASDGHELDAYEVNPDGASIVVVHEIFGVNAPLDQVQAIAEAHPDVPVHGYEGADHGFNCDAHAQYDARSAAIALGRTLEFSPTTASADADGCSQPAR